MPVQVPRRCIPCQQCFQTLQCLPVGQAQLPGPRLHQSLPHTEHHSLAPALLTAQGVGQTLRGTAAAAAEDVRLLLVHALQEEGQAAHVACLKRGAGDKVVHLLGLPRCCSVSTASSSACSNARGVAVLCRSCHERAIAASCLGKVCSIQLFVGSNRGRHAAACHPR
jgi:hypothetical protein